MWLPGHKTIRKDDTVIRKGMITLALTLLATSTAWSQHKVEISPFVGWQFGGSANTVGGELSLKDAMNYGAIVDITVRFNTQAELYYSRQDTELRRDPFGLPKETLTDMTVQYFMAGGLMELQQGGRAIPFVSFTLGAAYLNPKQKNIEGRTISSETRFAMMLGLGAKMFMSERIGLRLQGHFNSIFMDTGGSVFCGGGGCSFGLFGWGIYQGEVSAAATVAF